MAISYFNEKEDKKKKEEKKSEIKPENEVTKMNEVTDKVLAEYDKNQPYVYEDLYPADTKDEIKKRVDNQVIEEKDEHQTIDEAPPLPKGSYYVTGANIKNHVDTKIVYDEKGNMIFQESLEGKNVLVFGTSYMASHIILDLLHNQNTHVYVVDRKPIENIFGNRSLTRYMDSPKLHKLYSSLFDFPDKIIKLHKEKPFDCVINTINIHDVKYSIDNPVETVQINSIWTGQIIQTLRNMDYNNRFIHLSTDKVYGIKMPQTDDEFEQTFDFKEQTYDQHIKPVPETFPCNPVGIRATTRYMQENIVRGLCRTYGIPYMILRLGTTWGDFTPFEKCLNQWVINALNQEPYVLYNVGRASMDLVNVFDVARLVRVIAEKDLEKSIDNEIYNVGSGGKYEQFVSNIVGGIQTVLSPINPDGKVIKKLYPTKEEHIERHNIRSLMDISKTQKKLGYVPLKEYDAIKFHRIVTLYIAEFELKMSQIDMLRLERVLGIYYNTDRRVKAMKELDMLPEHKRKRLMKELGIEEEMSSTMNDTINRMDMKVV